MVSIWNYDRLGRNIFLGEVLTQMGEKIDRGELDGQNSEWYDLEEMVSKYCLIPDLITLSIGQNKYNIILNK